MICVAWNEVACIAEECREKKVKQPFLYSMELYKGAGEKLFNV